MLHNDDVNRREYVVQVLLKVIDGLTVDDAVNVMQEAHVNGLACVIQCGQEQVGQDAQPELLTQWYADGGRRAAPVG
eukprot:scaffold6740_cov350-Prasinococcus_capsulatus_cf.AAC.1